MLYVLAAVCTVLMILSIMLIFLSLPGTWAIMFMAGVWAAFTAAPEFNWQFFALLAALAGFGEVAEFFAGHFGAKRYGGSNKGSLGGMIGAIIGAILGASFFLGFGALPGALAGSFAGCFFMERNNGLESGQAARAAYGATLGRFGGFVVKLGIGICMVWLCLTRIWGGL